MPMHLAIIAERLIPGDHAGQQALLLAETLVAAGHRVSLVADVAIETDTPPGVDLVCHHGGKFSTLTPGLIRYRRWLTRILPTLSADHTIAFTTMITADVVIPCNGTVKAMARALRDLHAPLPARVKAWRQSVMPAMQIRLNWEKRTLADPNASAIIADNECIEEQLQTHFPDTAERITRIRPATPERSIDSKLAAQLRGRLARGLNLSEDANWLIFPFDSAWVDGLEPLMLAFKSLVDRAEDVMLLLAGPWRYTHLSWVAQLGLRDRVRFLGRPDHPVELIAAADLVVQPTGHDPGGAWALAALMQGKPIITTPANGASPWIETGRGTVLSSPVRPDTLAQAIAEAITVGGRGTASGLDFPAEPRAQAILALLAGEMPA